MQYQQIPQPSHSFPSKAGLSWLFHISLLECPNCIGDAACPTRGKGRNTWPLRKPVAVDALCNCATFAPSNPAWKDRINGVVQYRCLTMHRGASPSNTRRKPIAVGWAELHLSRPPLWCLSLQMFRWTSGPSVSFYQLWHIQLFQWHSKSASTPLDLWHHHLPPTTYHLPPHGTTMILPGDMLATSAATAAPHRFTLMQRYFGTKGEPHDGIPTEEELVFWRKNIWETTSALIFCFKITGSVLIGNRLGKEPARSIEEMAKRRALRTSQGCWPERFKKKLHVFLRRKVGNMFGWHRKYWKIPLRASFLRNRENPYEALAHPMTLGMLAPLLRSWISFRCYLILGGPVRDEELGIYVSNQPTTKT